jgi:2-iminobutanoate/2-iminopropanoate deaminase
MSPMKMTAVVLVLALAACSAFAQGKKADKKSDKQASGPQPVSTKDAPAPTGAYSQAIKANGFVFVSGTTAKDPATNKLIEGDIVAQTERVLNNISAVLTAAGSSMDKVVKATVFLKNIADFPKMNETYGKFFKGAPPTRSTVAVVAIPGDAIVEIDVIATQ